MRLLTEVKNHTKFTYFKGFILKIFHTCTHEIFDRPKLPHFTYTINHTLTGFNIFLFFNPQCKLTSHIYWKSSLLLKIQFFSSDFLIYKVNAPHINTKIYALVICNIFPVFKPKITNFYIFIEIF